MLEDFGATLEEQSEALIEQQQGTVDILRKSLGLDGLWDMAEKLSLSTVIPVAYQHRPENCFIALDMASRMGVSPFVVMQNLYIIQGKPSFSGGAIAAMVRANPTLKDVELHYVGTPNTDSWGAYVTATNVKTGKELKGGTVTIGTAKKEGWYQKNGSKWQTMPEMMLGYRAYAWFGRLFTPETMMGLQSTDEIEDCAKPSDAVETVKNPFEK